MFLLLVQLGRYMFKWLDGRRPASDVEWRLYDRTVQHAISLLDEHFKVYIAVSDGMIAGVTFENSRVAKAAKAVRMLHDTLVWQESCV